jgi:hypothetical protein
MHVIFAQSLGEYGALSSLTAGVQQLTYSIGEWLGSLSATEWTVAVVVVVGLVILMRR